MCIFGSHVHFMEHTSVTVISVSNFSQWDIMAVLPNFNRGHFEVPLPYYSCKHFFSLLYNLLHFSYTNLKT